MICADRDIILLNKKLDKETRRDVYIPTRISGVSVYDKRQSSKDGGFHEETEDFKIRIPISADVQQDKQYIPEAHYDTLTVEKAVDYWTLHNEDLIIIIEAGLDSELAVFETDVITSEQAEALAKKIGFQKEIIRIVDYSDNTHRGSNRVKHWRIGGT